MYSIKKYFKNLNTTQKIFLLFAVFNSLLMADNTYWFYGLFFEKKFSRWEEFTFILIILSVLAFFLFSNKNEAKK